MSYDPNAAKHYKFPSADGTNSQVLTTDGAGTLGFSSTGGSRTLLNSFTGTGSTNSVTFSAIPQTFWLLQIESCGRSTDATTKLGILNIQFNGDTGSNYDIQFWNGSGTSSVATVIKGNTSSTAGIMPGTLENANACGQSQCQIVNYSNSTFQKVFRSNHMCLRGADGADNQLETAQDSGRWRSTAAITSVTLICSNGNFETGTTIHLYGVN